MSVLTLVRHGQASFFEANYDQLSPLGEQQSAAVGQYWARQKLHFERVYSGPRVRQRRSAELAVAACRHDGQPCPDPEGLPGLDEYDLKGLLRKLLPELCRINSEFNKIVERHLQSGTEERLVNFQGMFEPLLHYWQTPEAAAVPMESWPDFRTRVENVIRKLQDSNGRGQRIALFTSGGFIGRATQLALAAPDRTALELHWRLRNASFTEFVFTRDRLTLDSFNAVPHLQSPELLTYR